MGEKDPATIKKIVTEIGVELSIKLFDETKEVERGGGMKTADGTRRRTPGGIFITLFKMDPNVTKEQKTRIFGDMRQVDKQKSRSRKRARDFGKKLEDVKKTMEEAAKPADVFDDEEVCEMV
ncbi:unnamed protein product [Caenorhabditis angaria]|uniref:Phosphorylated adapter RNA export protein n=1 Tax=Caenorhabditis angaria TaxID=860376 RepID=A0A9P1N3G3_9PELO|nr:unnamed protein product [Caenorhabditis angaria]